LGSPYKNGIFMSHVQVQISRHRVAGNMMWLMY
jgi:hypothetical protein